MIDQAITELVQYGLDTGLVAPEDKIFVTNQILEALGLESYEETPGSRGAEELEQILKEITDYAVEKELIADSIVYRDLFDTKIMGKLVPLPSMVSHKFYELYQEGPKKATDYFYKLSQDSDYIRRYRIKKDQKWITKTPIWGDWRSPSICPNRKKIRKRSRQRKMLHRVVIRNASCVRKMKATPVASIIRQDRITGSFRSRINGSKTGDSSIHRMYITMSTASFSTESMCR